MESNFIANIFHNLSELVFYSDNIVVSFFEENHRFLYWLEYALFPTALFLLIMLIARKDKPNSKYYGTAWSTEVLARNWIELTITFTLSWFLFEFRLYTEGLPFFTTSDGGLILSRIFSYGIYVSILTIFSSRYFLSSRKNLELKEYSAKVIPTIRMALLPVILFINLHLDTLLYDMIFTRVVILLSALIIGLLYFKVQSFTHFYWYEKFLNVSNTQKDQIKGITYLIRSSMKLSYRNGDLGHKISRLLKAKDHSQFIAKEWSLNRKNATYLKALTQLEAILSKTIKEYSKQDKENELIFLDKLKSALDQVEILKK